MKKIITTTLIAAAVAITPSVTDAGGQEKAAVCHDGDNGIELISIADPAVDKHIAHGDIVPGQVLDDGSIVADDCTLIPPDPASALEDLCPSPGSYSAVPFVNDGYTQHRCDGLPGGAGDYSVWRTEWNLWLAACFEGPWVGANFNAETLNSHFFTCQLKSAT